MGNVAALLITTDKYRKNNKYLSGYICTMQASLQDTYTLFIYHFPINIQYTYIVGKYKIYLYELQKQAEQRSFGDLFWPVSQRVQMNFIFSDNVRILCLSCNVKKVGKLVRFKQKGQKQASFLQLIYTKSLDTGEVPADWRTANVSPVYKKGLKSAAEDYRPISLTSVCCKILEHIIARNIVQH